jgi:hypothetical protein
MAERPYSRVYWSIIDDPKFEDVYDNDAHLAAWLRLLMIADQAYPASAHIPTNVQLDSVARLEDVGLIEVSGHRYRVHGLASEREMRSQSARNAAAVRWQSESNARRDETSKDKTSTPLPLTRGRRTNGTNPRATGDNPRSKGTSVRQEREREKRGPSQLHEILSAIQKGERA